MTLLYGVAAVLLFWWVSKLFASTNPKLLARVVKSAGGVVSLGVAALLMMRGRLDMALFVGGIGAWLLGWSATGPGGMRFPWGKGSSETAGARSKVASVLLAMELDHDSGGMTGTVSGGTFAGRNLDPQFGVKREQLTQERSNDHVGHVRRACDAHESRRFTLQAVGGVRETQHRLFHLFGDR